MSTRDLTRTELSVLKSLVGKEPVTPGAARNQALECLVKMGYAEPMPYRITKLGLKEMESYE